ncbi:hypothetical protein [Halorarum halobium]|uniref:hypothetical protein n=1 Tax=Halorarum halobium TaxID=3075121 RepID=UPI0028ABAC02|nr:hypothetical protein [Halobaculum sp. XH14]
MTKTSSNRCSELVQVLVVLALLVAAVAPAAAVSVGDEDVPETGEVGSEVTATLTLTELYSDYDSWQLAGSTGLENVTWTVTYYDQAGNQVNQQSYDGGTFNGSSVSIDDGTDQVDVRVTGTVPPIEAFTYGDQQEFRLLELRQVREGGTSDEITARNATHYTEESREAREALDSAAAAIESAGTPANARETFDSAVNAYEGENFDNAVTLAERAEREANRASSTQQRNRYVLYGVAGLLVLAIVVGGVLYWRSQRDSYDRLG